MTKAYYFIMLTIVFTSFAFLIGCQQTDSADESSKQEIIVLAAASLTDALQEVKEVFEQVNQDIKITYSYGSSGNLAGQIEHGAPADLFLAASPRDMDILQEKGLIVEETRTVLARNELVLIASKESPPSLSSFAELNSNLVTHLAIGNPASVPVGRYTQEVLEHLNLWDELQANLVFGSDVRQVLTYVETGNADLGVVYASDALTSMHVHVLGVADNNWHTPIVYPGAVIKHANQAEAAQALLKLLTSPKGQAILTKYGFKSI